VTIKRARAFGGALLAPLGISGLSVLLHVKCIKESINRGLCLRDQFFCSGIANLIKRALQFVLAPTRNESRPALTIREGSRDGEGNRQLAYGLHATDYHRQKCGRRPVSAIMKR